MQYLLEEKIEIVLDREYTFEVDCFVREYYIFNSFWDAPIGSVLVSKHEDDPQSLVHDKFSIALVNSHGVTVGHLPMFMSKPAHFFIKHAGHISCKVTGSKRYSKVLEQGGVEIHAKITFINSIERIIGVAKKKLLPLLGGGGGGGLLKNTIRDMCNYPYPFIKSNRFACLSTNIFSPNSCKSAR